MDITRFLDKPNTPVPIPRDASLIQEKCIIAGNLAMQELSVKKKRKAKGYTSTENKMDCTGEI